MHLLATRILVEQSFPPAGRGRVGIAYHTSHKCFYASSSVCKPLHSVFLSPPAGQPDILHAPPELKTDQLRAMRFFTRGIPAKNYCCSLKVSICYRRISGGFKSKFISGFFLPVYISKPFIYISIYGIFKIT